MVVANIHSAKTNLSKLIEQAEAGEEVVIARNGTPVVRLVPVTPLAPSVRRPDGLPAWMGSLKGQIWVGANFDDADAGITQSFAESEIFPREDEAG